MKTHVWIVIRIHGKHPRWWLMQPSIVGVFANRSEAIELAKQYHDHFARKVKFVAGNESQT